MSQTPKLSKRFQGEVHMMMVDFKNGVKRAEYCGPGTKIEKRILLGIKPLNSTDSVCKAHDVDYLRITRSKINLISKGEEVRKADELMLKRLNKIRNINASIAKSVIHAKIAAENLGLLKKTKFVSF